MDEQPEPTDPHETTLRAVRAAVEQMLAEGSRPLAAVLGRLRDDGILDDLLTDLDRDTDDAIILAVAEDVLLDVPGIWITDDDSVHVADTLLDGVVLTHRVTADELQRGALDAEPDLAPIMVGFDDGAQLVGGGEVTLTFGGERGGAADGRERLVGPQGWLDGVEPGALVALRRRRDRIELVRDPDVGDATVDDAADALEAMFDAMAEPGLGADATELVMEAIAADAEVFRVVRPPIAEQLDHVGLRCDRGVVEPADDEWEDLDERSPSPIDRFERVAERYQLESCCREALESVVAAFEQHVTAARGVEVGEPIELDAVADDLHHGAVVVAFEEYVATEPDAELDLVADADADAGAVAGEHLGSFASALVDGGSRTAGPGHHIAALVALRGGHARDAVEALERSVRADGYGTPAATQLATLLADAGDVARSLATWRRLEGIPGQAQQVAVLSELLDRYHGARRNDPCPCGSGRKYKQCCALQPKLGTTERRRLAQHQLALDATQRLGDQRFGLALTAAGADEDDHHDHDHHDHGHHDHDHDHDHDGLVARLRHWATHPFMVDVLVHEAGGLEEYLAERGELIPGDERTWLELLLDTPRAVWEIVPAAAGRATVRSILTGTTVDDVELRPADPVRNRHGWVLGRLLLDGVDGRPGFIGAVLEVPTERLGTTVLLTDGRPVADELMAWAAGGSITPTLPDPDGAPLPMGSAHFRPPDAGWDAARAELDDRFTPDGDGGWRLVAHLGDHPNPELTLASLAREGDELVLTVFTGGRMAELRDELIEAGFTWLRAELNPDVYGGGYDEGDDDTDGTD